MISYSGGSSFEANFSAPFGDMSIDLVFMGQILTLHEDDMDVIVQPPVRWVQLNAQIKYTSLFSPIDPWPISQDQW